MNVRGASVLILRETKQSCTLEYVDNVLTILSYFALCTALGRPWVDSASTPPTVGFALRLSVQAR